MVRSGSESDLVVGSQSVEAAKAEVQNYCSGVEFVVPIKVAEEVAALKHPAECSETAEVLVVSALGDQSAAVVVVVGNFAGDHTPEAAGLEAGFAAGIAVP